MVNQLTATRLTALGRSENLCEWNPAIIRPGRRFQPIAEKELDLDLRSLAARLPGSAEGVHAIAEFVGPAGVADIVAVTRADEGLARRFELDVPPLTSLADAIVVSAVAVGRATSVQHVVSATGMSVSQTNRRLRRLAAIGALTEEGAGYRRAPALVPIGRMYALEAKVSDWRQALSQAVRYAHWSDAAGIVLLRAPRDLDGLQTYARNMRIGVAIGDKWLIRPVIDRPNPGPRLLASEYLAASLMQQRG